MVRRAALTWAAMVPVAIFNGTFRELALKPVLGDQTARQASVATASLAFLVLAYLLMREHVVDETDRRLLKVGIAWLAATIVFEFGFGHFVDGKGWGELLHDYNIFAGRLWPLFLGIEVLAPLLVKRYMLWQESNGHRIALPCPAATASLDRLAGTPISAWRQVFRRRPEINARAESE